MSFLIIGCLEPFYENTAIIQSESALYVVPWHDQGTIVWFSAVQTWKLIKGVKTRVAQWCGESAL